MAKTRHRLSKHFVIEEFDCHDGTRVKSREFAGLEYLCRQFLEPLRRQFGACSVHSGYRTRDYNRQIGGAANSFHIYPAHDGNDQAVDVSFARAMPVSGMPRPTPFANVSAMARAVWDSTRVSFTSIFATIARIGEADGYPRSVCSDAR
jgi:hypothetical protein